MIAGIPYDAEVEYLESTGTQYVNTGVVPTIDTSCVLDYMDVTFVGWGVILGSATSDNNADSWYLRGNGARPGFSFRIDGKCADQQIFVSLGTRVLCIASKDSFSVDDVTKTIGATAYSSTPTLPMYLFACNLNGSPWSGRLCKGRVYSCRIYQGSVLVRHYIPVRVGTEGCLYDRVSRKLFRNQGTGDPFVAGPDVAVPVMGLHFMRRPRYTAKDYVQGGLVAMWDGIENAGWGVHDANATVWKDLVGSRDATLAGDISWGANYIHRAATSATSITLPDVEIKPGFAIDYCMALTNNGDANFRDFSTTSGLRMEIVRLTNGSLQRYYRNTKDSYVSRTGTTPFGLSTYAQRILIGFDSIGGYGAFDGGSVWYDQTENTILKDYGTIQSLAVGKYGTLYENANYHRICIYSRALTANEIAHNYAVDKERFDLP